MKRVAQPALSKGQQALDQYTRSLQQMEDFFAVTIHNYVSDLRQFMAWYEAGFQQEQDEQPFTPQTIAPPLLICYRTYLQTILWLKPSTINRALMSLKQYFAWAARTQIIQYDPMSAVKLFPKETTAPRHLDNDEEDALVAAVSATSTLQDRAIITFLFHMGLRTQELCTLTRKQAHPGKRNGVLRVIDKRKKVRDVPLNATARSVLSKYLETQPQESIYLFPLLKFRL